MYDYDYFIACDGSILLIAVDVGCSNTQVNAQLIVKIYVSLCYSISTTNEHIIKREENLGKSRGKISKAK